GAVVYPIFRGRGTAKLTDFNDLHASEGLDEVAEQLIMAMQWLHKL
ncbi:MAG: hypothetical protein RL375_260, partial [Pseudomonadota bacterium]